MVVRWSSKDKQCEVLPSTAHARQNHSQWLAADPQKIYPRLQSRVRAPGGPWGPANGRGRAQGLSPALLDRWQRQAVAEAVPSSAERDEIKRLRAELKRVEQVRDILKKVVTSFAQPPQS